MLEINDLRVVYPNGYEALKSVTLKADDGEIVALIGRSGAGKSTILRCINGIQPVTSGRILLHGVDVTSMSGSELQLLRRRVGFIWQEHNLVERLTVMKNVLTGRLGYINSMQSFFHWFGAEHRQIAVSSLERVNMTHRATQRADRLSGGEKQRVSIARALAQQPEIIVADEPVASLDVELAWQVMNDLVRVSRSEKVPTLISIHDVDLAKAFCDRIVGLAQGEIVFDGPPSALDQVSMDLIYRFDKPIDLSAATGPTPIAIYGGA
ncbi:MAG TPA: phosphonate ABC transporter ATP-binding protein [Thermomicrobiales bacterium]|nr:phosphonate ABC transporter ATP-binding protein [Thermomicrobiales bacterium]